MKAIVITQPGAPEVLQLEERPKPVISNGEVLIEVKAAGVNRPDVIQRLGKYPAPKGVPADIPGLEVAGVVREVNDKNGRWNIGDEVCVLVGGGGYAEYVAVPAAQCLPIPKGLNFVEAASLPETFFTVWTNVFDRAHFKNGDVCLVHGGTSGIGVTAIQMINALGGKVYVTAGSKEKCEYAEQIGAYKAINYREHDFEDELGNLEPTGVDIILDMIGGDYIPKNINLLKVEGRLVIINAMKGRVADVDLMKVMVKRLTITGSTLRPREVAFKHEIAKNLEKRIWPHLESEEIKPIIYKTYPLSEASEAHKLMESSEHIGKIVLALG